MMYQRAYFLKIINTVYRGSISRFISQAIKNRDPSLEENKDELVVLTTEMNTAIDNAVVYKN